MTTADDYYDAKTLEAIAHANAVDLAELEDLYDRARGRVCEIHNLMEASRKARAPAGSISKLHRRLQQARAIRNQAGAALQAFGVRA